MVPSLFVAHGAPLLAIEDNEYTNFLSDLGGALPHPRAVAVFSAHFESTVQQVGKAAEFGTIHDFGGFPEELYRIEYPAKGAMAAAADIEQALRRAGVDFEVNTERGLDHGAWVVLRLLYPSADVPVVSLSVNSRLNPEEQYAVGAALRSLREADVLVIGSGGTVHNLGALDSEAGAPLEWALSFDRWLEKRVLDWDLASLFRYREQAPGAELAVPRRGSEHFSPLLYAMGAADDAKEARLLHRSYRYGSLSHSVWQFG